MASKLTKEQQKRLYACYERLSKWCETKKERRRETKKERMRRRIEMLNNSFSKE